MKLHPLLLAASLACLVSLAALPLAVTAQTAPQPIGVAAAVVADVRLSNAASAQPRRVALRQRIALADLIQTGKASQLQVLLLDRSTFAVGANARLRIDRFVYDPAAGRSVGASVTKGAFRFMSGRPGRNGASAINTPVATIGIRGTIVDGVVGEHAVAIARDELLGLKGMRVDPEKATLVVLRGPGAATQGGLTPGAVSVGNSAGSVDLVAPMQASFVPREGAAPIGPFPISRKGMMRVQDRIFPALAQADGFPVLESVLGGAAIIGGVIGATSGNDNPDRQQGSNQTGP